MPATRLHPSVASSTAQAAIPERGSYGNFAFLSSNNNGHMIKPPKQKIGAVPTIDYGYARQFKILSHRKSDLAFKNFVEC